MLRHIWGAIKLGIGLFVGLIIWQHRDEVNAVFRKAALEVKAMKPSEELQMQTAAQSWLRTHMADPNAQIMAMGRALPFESGPAAMASVRGRNVFNGPIIVDYLFEFNRDGDHVILATTVKEWMSIYGQTRATDRARADDYALLYDELKAQNELWKYLK
jgi:hypothetical protein